MFETLRYKCATGWAVRRGWWGLLVNPVDRGGGRRAAFLSWSSRVTVHPLVADAWFMGVLVHEPGAP